MRRILVENARRKQSLKHGGGRTRIDLEEDNVEVFDDVSPEDLIALDEALARFAEAEPVKAEVVKLRYFAGLSLPQVAHALGISLSTADSHWAYARCWLRLEMSGEEGTSSLA
jgi:RNA polymerase sigma factor (TIGR02999 family)